MAVVHVVWLANFLYPAVASLYKVNQIAELGVFAIPNWSELRDFLHYHIRNKSGVTIKSSNVPMPTPRHSPTHSLLKGQAVSPLDKSIKM